MNITNQQIKEKAKQWSSPDPDQPETCISSDESRIAYESFIRGAEWMQDQIEKENLKSKNTIQYSITSMKCPKCKACYLNKDRFGYDCFCCGFHKES